MRSVRPFRNRLAQLLLGRLQAALRRVGVLVVEDPDAFDGALWDAELFIRLA